MRTLSLFTSGPWVTLQEKCNWRGILQEKCRITLLLFFSAKFGSLCWSHLQSPRCQSCPRRSHRLCCPCRRAWWCCPAPIESPAAARWWCNRYLRARHSGTLSGHLYALRTLHFLRSTPKTSWAWTVIGVSIIQYRTVEYGLHSAPPGPGENLLWPTPSAMQPIRLSCIRWNTLWTKSFVIQTTWVARYYDDCVKFCLWANLIIIWKKLFVRK